MKFCNSFYELFKDNIDKRKEIYYNIVERGDIDGFLTFNSAFLTGCKCCK